MSEQYVVELSGLPYFWGISSSPAAFLFLIFLRTESSSSGVNGPSLMSNCLLIILVIGSCKTFGGFPSRFSKCCFHSFILCCWFSAFNFALVVLSSTKSLIQSNRSGFVCILSVLLDICLLIDIVPFLVLWHLYLLGSSYSFWGQFPHVHVFL